jgi:methionine-rich copper-binding protein CopC
MSIYSGFLSFILVRVSPILDLSMRTSMKLLPLMALLSLAALSVPFAAAHPINPSLTWSSSNVAQGSTTTATATVSVDADCPVGQTFSGTITVTEPDGTSVGTFAVGPTACGTNVTAIYPTAFAGTAGTTELGTYTTSWVGTSSVVTNGVHPTFDITTGFIVVSFQPPPVPQFGLPAMVVAALGLVMVAAVKKGRLFNF